MNTFELIIATAHSYLPEYLAEHAAREDMAKRTGGVLCVFRELHEEQRLETIGTLPEDKLSQKRGFAAEKIARLYMRRRDGHQDITSMKTQNYANDEYGGGVWAKVEDIYVSFSGFPPYYDTEFVCRVLRRAEVISDVEYAAIMEEAFMYQEEGVPK